MPYAFSVIPQFFHHLDACEHEQLSEGYHFFCSKTDKQDLTTMVNKPLDGCSCSLFLLFSILDQVIGDQSFE